MCNQCGQQVQVTERWLADSTDGPLEMVTIRCDGGHWLAAAMSDLVNLGVLP